MTPEASTRREAVLEGPLFLASDPTVLRFDEGYAMYYRVGYAEAMPK